MKTHALLKELKKLVPEKLELLLLDLIFKRFMVVEVETTTACNRRCSYCPNSRFDRGLLKNKKLMPTRLFFKLIDELSEINFKGSLHPHFYGEPLLDERLPGLVKYARLKLPKADITIFTNGDLLTPKIKENLIKAGVDNFVIKKSQEDLKSLSNRGGLLDYSGGTRFKYCSFPSKFVVIDYAGNVILCCNDYFSSVKFGNINNEKLMDIWNKPNYRRVRRDLRKGIFNLEICKNCKVIEKN